MITKSLKKISQMIRVKGTMGRQIIGGIGKSNKRILLMERGLINTPHSPLSGVFEATTPTLATRQVYTAKTK
jgi:hypothetical protein